jgi:peptidoglycan/LPS O-acetylase OafA/YrhL
VSADRADLGQVVAHSADAAGLHAPVPTLLLELQTLLGGLAAAVAVGTERGRRPFRPGPDWPDRLGELAYGLYLLADQTGVDVGEAVTRTAWTVGSRRHQPGAEAQDWSSFGPDAARQ